MGVCGKCNEIVDDEDDDFVVCDGLCDKKYHIKCSVGKTVYNKFVENENLLFLCEECRKFSIKSLNGHLRKIMSYLFILDEKLDRQNSKMINLSTSLEEVQRDVKLKEIPKEQHEQETEVKLCKVKQNVQKVSEGEYGTEAIHLDATRNKSYSGALMVKPVKEQNSNITRSDLADKIDPAKLEIGINSMKNIRNGGVLIDCGDKKARGIMSAKLGEEFGNKYKIEETKLRNPKIVIRGAENKYMECDDRKIIESIIAQNDLRVLDEDVETKIKVVRKYINRSKKNVCNIILETDCSLYERIKSWEKLNIGWRRCLMADYYNVVRCFKCAGYNHFSGECKNERVCFKCSGDHEGRECESTEHKCVNCMKKVESLKIDLDVNHTAYDENCPCYKRIIEAICRKTNFGEK